ncbi:MAG: hypothetical protein NW224_18475 [Leptolyngbyaceae cyanobacterium bins.302]|nr:hypothetical protein [Leptolyngbyaceae cyanobacterium bins.302]
MSRQLKRWESPRREGRNDKGRGGAARQRQRRKQFQALRQKLKEQSTESSQPEPKNTNINNQTKKGSISASLFRLFFLAFSQIGVQETQHSKIG